jgi:predicted ATPase
LTNPKSDEVTVMAITNIKVSNFKSFKDLDLNLGRFNVVIGANASGKSNFVEVFRFLKTIEQNDLEDAISLRGGRDSILNKKLNPSEPLRMQATSDRQMEWGGVWSLAQVYRTIYDFCIQFESPQNGAIVKDDHLTQRIRSEIDDEAIEMSANIVMSEGKRKVEIGPQDIVDRIKDLPEAPGTLPTAYQYMWGLGRSAEMWKGNALVIRAKFFGFIGSFESLFGRVGVYDMEPRAIKRGHEEAGRASLEENGENLVLVLKSILADPEKSRKLHNLLQYMLPFAKEIGVEQPLGVSLLLKLRESYYDDSLLANLLSDGTVDVVALIVALFFEDKDVVIIEEPERNLHPRLISGLVELMKDASRNRQIIVTTHSPELVKHAGVENLLLISRSKEGYSTISRPAEKEAVKIFLEHDLGLDTLFVQNALAVP